MQQSRVKNTDFCLRLLEDDFAFLPGLLGKQAWRAETFSQIFPTVSQNTAERRFTSTIRIHENLSLRPSPVLKKK